MFSKLRNLVCIAVLVAAGSGRARPAVKADDSSTSSSTKSATIIGPRSGKGLIWDSTQQPSHRRVEPGLPNFGLLNANVWRSGQPTPRAFDKLAEMHVKTIVNLRAEAPAEKGSIPDGITSILIPIKDETAPTEEQARKFLDIVANPNNWPVLVHCQGGQGRTGVMCALVRYSIDGWDDKRMMEEVSNFRIAHLGLFKTRICGSQRRFIQQWEKNHQPGEYSTLIKSRHPSQP